MTLDLDEAVTAYVAQGVCFIKGAFSKRWVDRVAEGIEEALQSPGPHEERYGPEGA